jgi:hypothetical protein
MSDARSVAPTTEGEESDSGAYDSEELEDIVWIGTCPPPITGGGMEVC